MARKMKPYLKLVKPMNLEELKKRTRYYRKARIKRWLRWAVLVGLAVYGTGLLMSYHCYDTMFQINSYKQETADNCDYAVFKRGIVRYTRDGVTFLNKQNEEQWIQPSQFKNPAIDLQRDVFAVADIGGNAIQVFTESGLKGEIQTTLPIEKFSVSNQGIVSVILKNETMPQIVTYDAVGNVLVENQIAMAGSGYPMALEMSPDGQTLMVSFISAEGGVLKSRVSSYNFAEEGKKAEDLQVGSDEFKDTVIPEIYYMDNSTAVAIGDHSFVLYKGAQVPKKSIEIPVEQQIKSSFHTEKYIGFVLLNKEKSGYEVRLYNKDGVQVMNRAFEGDYDHVQMIGDEIIMFDGSSCCIITEEGVPHFKGDLKSEAMIVVPAAGWNKYLVMSANELRVMLMTK